MEQQEILNVLKHVRRRVVDPMIVYSAVLYSLNVDENWYCIVASCPKPRGRCKQCAHTEKSLEMFRWSAYLLPFFLLSFTVVVTAVCDQDCVVCRVCAYK